MSFLSYYSRLSYSDKMHNKIYMYNLLQNNELNLQILNRIKIVWVVVI